jgi:hypothetical protein
MRNAHVAEWVLSLVTDPARAMSMVGDLIEESPSHGPLWFWATVSRTALSLVWRDITSNPWRVARLAAFGLLVEYLLLVAMFLLLFLVTFGAMLIVAPNGAPDSLSSTPFPGFTGLAYVMIMLVQFQAGRVVARRSPGQELAPCVVLTLLATAVDVVSAWFGGGPLTTSRLVLDWGVYPVLSVIPLFAGAVLVRHRREHA